MAKCRRNKSAMEAARQAKSKRAKAAMTMPPVLPLPDDLVDAVFLRLPARTVAACRCVSPAWNRRLSSPAFTAVFSAFSAAAARGAPTFVSVPVDPRQHDRATVVADPVPTTRTRCLCERCPRVFLGAAKTCNGLFFLGRPCEGALDACNPTTGGVLRLPPRRPEQHLFHSAGLGYDAAAGAHKAVLLERVVEDLPRLRPRRTHPRLQCVVVTLGGQQWRWRAPRGPRAASVAFHDAIVSADLDPVFADGRLHWNWKLHAPTGRREATTLGEPNGILSFSVGDESFSRLPLPSFAAFSPHSQPSSSPSNRTQSQCTTMGELDGRLCMVRDLRGDCKAGTSVLEVWKLHYGGHESSGSSWSLDCRIDLSRIDDWTLPWILTAVSPLRYVGGERRRILLSAMEQTATAYIYDLDSGGLQTVARSSYIGTECTVCTRFFLCQESPLHIAGMEYGALVVKYDHIYT